MPAGDPAGYLPNVMKARRRAKRYVPRSKQPVPAKGSKRPGLKIGFNQSMQNAARSLSLQKIRSARGQATPKDSITKARMQDMQRQYKTRKR